MKKWRTSLVNLVAMVLIYKQLFLKNLIVKFKKKIINNQGYINSIIL